MDQNGAVRNTPIEHRAVCKLCTDTASLQGLSQLSEDTLDTVPQVKRSVQVNVSMVINNV